MWTFGEFDFYNDAIIERFRHWINTNNIETLNIAGNSEQTSPGIFDKASDILRKLL